jgi:hypothetical protein
MTVSPHIWFALGIGCVAISISVSLAIEAVLAQWRLAQRQRRARQDPENALNSGIGLPFGHEAFLQHR